MAFLLCVPIASFAARVPETATGVRSAQLEQIAPSPGAVKPLPKTGSAAPQAALNDQELRNWYGRRVAAVQFEGISREELGELPGKLALQPGDWLSAQNVGDTLRRLYATGLYRDILAEAVESGGRISVVFRGSPQRFFRRLYIRGVKRDSLAARLERATHLTAGQPFSEEDLKKATEDLKQALARNGFYQPTISAKTKPAGPENLEDAIFTIDVGKRATVGTVTVAGNPGMTVPHFRKTAKLKEGSHVTVDTVPRALNRLRKHYRKQGRLEATVREADQSYRPAYTQVDYTFRVNRGPIVRVEVAGAKISKKEIKRLIPVYEEAAVDPDLLDEGGDNLRNHFQRKGYFDVQVTHSIQETPNGEMLIDYKIDPGPLHKLVAVTVDGNRYFKSVVVQQRLQVRKADSANRYGTFSRALLDQDVESIEALYRSNGFANVQVTPELTSKPGSGEDKNIDLVHVTYRIREGAQQRIGKIRFVGAQQVAAASLLKAMDTESGQPYSPTVLAGDQARILDDYYRHGFTHAAVSIEESPEESHPDRIDVTVRIHEGLPAYVHRILISGLEHTDPEVVQKLLAIRPGEPVDAAAISETQRRLNNLALFNAVDAGVVNAGGTQRQKDVLLNLTEAPRWNFDYGFGFEVQTGTPSHNCPNAATRIQLGIPASFKCSPNGTFGVSPRISFDISRTNLGGRNRTATLQTAYGTLEQQAILTFDNPRFLGHKSIDFSISGGYVSNQDVTTYEASTISGSVLFTERPNPANTLIYSMAYRYVYVNPNSLQVSAELVPLLSQPTRVSGPGITWVHDTRNNPLNATRGWYFSAQEFFAWHGLASQANFNRLDMQESNYYRLPWHNWILARSTRIGFESTYGSSAYDLIPLPERLYAGGATSHRGFSVNAAGPRDLQTGFPVGGSAAFVNSTELRVPPVSLPWIGDNLGFAIFEDFGNVYQNVSDMFPALLRWNQPDVQTCYDLTPPSGKGTCNFNYDSHAAGLGLRYRTPIGPVRADFSYNMNPTVYPVVADPAYLPQILNYNGQPPYVGNSGHFNFFFSIGQAF